MKLIKLLLCLLLPGLMIAQRNIYKEVSAYKNQGLTFEVLNLFDEDFASPSDYGIDQNSLTKGQIFKLNVDEVRRLKANNYEYAVVYIPGPDGRLWQAIMSQQKVFTDDFQLIASSNPTKSVPYEPGIHFKGYLTQDPSSLVALSVFNEQIMGLISTQGNNYVIGRVGENDFAHIMYDDKDLQGSPPGECATIDDGGGYTTEQLTHDASRDAGDCIQIYIEIDDDIVSQKGGVGPATTYVEGLFAQTYILYSNDGLTLQTSQILAWDTPAPYSGSSSSAMLSSFQANTGTFNGDLAHLVSYQASGGIAAGFSGICNANPDNSKCFSSIDASYSDVPNYSWSVMVVTHEMGHLIGSRHTHACVWNGNNTAIDGCAGSTEGSCPLPGNPAGGGTIMSYCHLTGVGINLALGFGPQPTAVIQSTVNNASCLDNCGGPGCNNGIQDGEETGVDCGGPDCPACPTCDDGIQNGNETGVDCGGPDCPACPPSYCSSSGNNSSYEYIENVQIADLNNTSGNNGGYADYTSLTANLDAGANYDITLTPEFPGATYTEYWKVWIDYNADYDFDDAGELVAEGVSTSAITLNFDVESLASNVTTRMRVSMKWNATQTSCETFAYGEVEDYTVAVSVGSGPTCDDGIQNGNETGVDCGGPDCPACPTCDDGVQNGDETGVDCGGPDCPACPTCDDGIQNGNETGVDCGGPDCPACPTCDDGIQNGNETGVDCGGPDCPACPTCDDGIQNGDETGVDCGGSCDPCTSCTDGIQNGDETGVDCGGSVCPPCTSCTDGIQNGDETGVDCGGSVCPACPTCTDGIQNGNETGVDCGGPDCPACPTCTDGIQNGGETGVDCGGPDCPACPTCDDGVQNGNETGVDCGGPDCPACPTCFDGIQNGDETGVDCGGSCAPCPSGCNYQSIDFNDFESSWGIWNDGGSDCRRSNKDANYAYSGVRPVRLRDNTSTSVMTTDDLDLTSYDEITVDFTYIARSMDNSNEDFWFQISTNGGSSYTTVEEWNRGDEFENNVREFDQVVVGGPFTSNTRLRFRCDASGNSDWVYIDDVDITGCYNPTALPEPVEEPVVREVIEELDKITDVNLYPNPARNSVNLEFNVLTDGDINLNILSLSSGNAVKSQNFYRNKGEHRVYIDLNDLPGGMYILQIVKDDQMVVKKLIVTK